MDDKRLEPEAAGQSEGPLSSIYVWLSDEVEDRLHPERRYGCWVPEEGSSSRMMLDVMDMGRERLQKLSTKSLEMLEDFDVIDTNQDNRLNRRELARWSETGRYLADNVRWISDLSNDSRCEVVSRQDLRMLSALCAPKTDDIGAIARQDAQRANTMLAGELAARVVGVSPVAGSLCATEAVASLKEYELSRIRLMLKCRG